MERQITLAPATWAALELIARENDQSVGQIIRDAIARDIYRREKAKTPIRADERLVAPLRALLADDFAYARDWHDLQMRLSGKGYRVAESGGGLVLQDAVTGIKICKGSEIGYSYSKLLARFDAPFPGHAHIATLRRVQSGSWHG